MGIPGNFDDYSFRQLDIYWDAYRMRERRADTRTRQITTAVLKAAGGKLREHESEIDPFDAGTGADDLAEREHRAASTFKRMQASARSRMTPEQRRQEIKNKRLILRLQTEEWEKQQKQSIQ